MNFNEFAYMRRGCRIAALESRARLAPIDIRKQGYGRALLLLHGFASSPAVYRLLAPKLQGYDAIVAPILPGHADSLASFAKVKAADWVLAAESHYETLAKAYQSVDVLGLSLGGLLASHLSQRYTLNHLYLLAPAFNVYSNNVVQRQLARLLAWLGIKHIPNYAGNLHTDTESELSYRKLPVSTIIEVFNFINNASPALPRCPTDIFLGKFDNVVDSGELAHRFARLPNVTIHWLKQSAHILPLDGDLKTIVDCINHNNLSIA